MHEFWKFLVPFSLVFGHKVSAVPLQTHQSGGDEHIVIIDSTHPAPPQVADVLQRLALNSSHSDVRHVYNNSAFQGFSASMNSHCLNLLANMTDVSLVEKVTSVSHAVFDSTTSMKRDSSPYHFRQSAPWGLQRISTSSAMSGNEAATDYTYSFADPNLGQGSDIYIIDTGIYTAHNVFSGRATMDWSFNGNMTDSDGHGTHVAGTAGGAILGVASNAKLHGIKALGADGGGVSSSVVAAIDYVISTHEKRSAQSGFVGSVISMSLATSSLVDAISSAISAATRAGVHVVVAAGNSGTDACGASPSSSGGTGGPAISVGAIGISGAVTSFSNTGSCVDVYAPGENVISSWIGGPSLIESLSGTSMATPHVTGIVACAMHNQTLARNPGLMKEWVRMTALKMTQGALLANNGVKADVGQGVLGLQRSAVSKTPFNVVKSDGNNSLAKR
ncbi:Hypothetical protein R9X50_00286000 [Acrodontium crateriforme]|uniref:Peptidase S8/S53 domain-containing protein n=1 Tax=Acrodontium crateriforme TaxID=150365 RepID=A0AAQ3M2Y5_9PEZI|nr:Hypothetical protein R9X50_00286000 [Acrodontium crateriforme]